MAQVDYAEKDKWAAVVKRRDPELLKNAILTLAGDQTLRKTLSQTAIATARRNHDSAVVRKRFQTRLAQAAHG